MPDRRNLKSIFGDNAVVTEAKLAGVGNCGRTREPRRLRSRMARVSSGSSAEMLRLPGTSTGK